MDSSLNMDIFSYQYQSSLLDSVYLPNLPMKATCSLDEGIGSSSLSHYPSSSLHASIPTENCMKSPVTKNRFSFVPLDENHTLSYSTSCNFAQQKNGTGNKRRNRDEKDAKEAQWKKQRKCNTSSRNSGEKLKTDKNQKKASEEPPSGYVHVRARRGQATDSHSLAERVRREKISQRMKLLQGLVPGCDKVTGKALMLDEIINYVQSLQNQVEFLSMKLASFSPVFFDLGEDSEGHMPQSETWGSLPFQSQSVQQNPELENAASALAHCQTPLNSAFSQGKANLLWEGEHQMERFLTRGHVA